MDERVLNNLILSVSVGLGRCVTVRFCSLSFFFASALCGRLYLLFAKYLLGFFSGFV